MLEGRDGNECVVAVAASANSLFSSGGVVAWQRLGTIQAAFVTVERAQGFRL